MITVSTSSVDETRAVGETIAGLVRSGDLLLLAGELGAGKTAFTQGFGRGLGVVDHITSPTFTLARHYPGRLELHHIDVYRLDHLGELLDVGLPELLDEGGVTVVEWGDVIVPALPAEFLEVRLAFVGDDEDGDGDGDDNGRTISLRPVGPRWHARARILAETLAPWAASC